MTAVIRCHTPLFVNKKDPSILSFALGNNISLCCVLGLPTLLSIIATLILPLDKLTCLELNFIFSLLSDSRGKGYLMVYLSQPQTVVYHLVFLLILNHWFTILLLMALLTQSPITPLFMMILWYKKNCFIVVSLAIYLLILRLITLLFGSHELCLFPTFRFK